MVGVDGFDGGNKLQL